MTGPPFFPTAFPAPVTDEGYAPVRSLLGALQRGRGSAVAFLRHDPAQALTVYECLARDTRWDPRLDARAVYLARLIRDLHLDPAPIPGDLGREVTALLPGSGHSSGGHERAGGERPHPVPRQRRPPEDLGPDALPRARRWAGDPDARLRAVGLSTLAAHGDERDLAVLLAAAARLTGWSGYDRLTEGATRIATTTDPPADLRRDLVRLLGVLLKGSPHSFERASYLRSMLRLEPEVTSETLPGFLFDCEPAVRLLAARHTPLTPDARGWLAELRDDPIEDAEVRAAATRRATP